MTQISGGPTFNLDKEEYFILAAIGQQIRSAYVKPGTVFFLISVLAKRGSIQAINKNWMSRADSKGNIGTHIFSFASRRSLLLLAGTDKVFLCNISTIFERCDRRKSYNFVVPGWLGTWYSAILETSWCFYDDCVACLGAECPFHYSVYEGELYWRYVFRIPTCSFCKTGFHSHLISINKAWTHTPFRFIPR